MTQRVWLITGVLAAAAFCLHVGAHAERVPLRRPLAEIPLQLGAWRGTDGPELDDDTRTVLAADDYLSRTYSRGGDPAQVLVAYYQSQQQGETIHSPLNCLPGSGWDVVTANRKRVDARGEVNSDVVQKGREKLLVVYWYESHGRKVASEYRNKAYLVLDALTLHRTDGALVRLMTPLRGAGQDAEQRVFDLSAALAPALGTFLPE